MKNLVLFFGVFIAISAHSAESKVTISLAGTIGNGEIVTIADARAKLVCFSVNGDSGASPGLGLNECPGQGS